jgi:2-dehydro-3-deoxyphosphogluconate aldolase/(4S)-4-hydroxy-2-oxoglutarate aldolase
MTAIDKIIPVVVVDNPDHAVELARLYKLSGISSIEITLRTQRAVECIKAIKDANLGMRLGVGTIINASEAATALELEVDFLVSPATSPDLLKFAQDVQVPMYLGFSQPKLRVGLLLFNHLVRFFLSFRSFQRVVFNYPIWLVT